MDQTPHAHKYNQSSQFPDYLAELAYNHCRNPDGSRVRYKQFNSIFNQIESPHCLVDFPILFSHTHKENMTCEAKFDIKLMVFSCILDETLVFYNFPQCYMGIL